MHLQLSLPADVAAAQPEWLDPVEAVVLVDASDGDGADDEETSTGSTIVGLLPFLLIAVAVYFLLLRPRQRQMRQQRELQSSIEVGDEVMLTSGVFGFITGIEDDKGQVWVEIDDDVQIRVTRAAVSTKVTAPAAAAAGAADDATEATSTSTPAPAPPAPKRPTLKGGRGGASSAREADATGEPTDG